jgi:phospholipid/cholesterol/gamma-HCH transport system substrate-binding protein
VKFRGVAIGRVIRISVAPDARHVEVIVLIEQDLKITPEMFAKLSLVGITGIMFVEIDVLPGEQRPEWPELTFEPPYPVIPARPSELRMILADVERVVTSLAELDLQALAGQAQETLKSFEQTAAMIRKAVDQLQVEKTAASFQAVIGLLHQELRQAGLLLEQAGGMLEQYGPEVQQSLDKFRSAMANLDQFTEQASLLVDETDANLAGLFRELLVISGDIEQTIQKVDAALDEFIASPRMLFRGPPPPRPVHEE